MYHMKKKNKEGRRWYLKFVVAPVKIFKKASVVEYGFYRIIDIARFSSFRGK